jgi:hypothetical protein
MPLYLQHARLPMITQTVTQVVKQQQAPCMKEGPYQPLAPVGSLC